jgi:osomolarity two-component system sensor histidine kinase NIK1
MREAKILDLKNTINGMVVQYASTLCHASSFLIMVCDRLQAPAAEATLEVESQGILGGQAHVPDVEEVWFKLVRNVRSHTFFLLLGA